MKRIFVLLTLIGCFCAPALGVAAPVQKTSYHKLTPEKPSFSSFSLNGGTHTEFYNNVQSDGSGGLRKFDLAPVLGTSVVAPLGEGFSFIPEFNWVLPQSAGSSQIIKNIFMFRVDLGYDLLDWLRLRTGTGFIWNNMHGRGGKKEMKNGNSTSTFYYPDENRSALNNTFDLGLELLLSKEWSFRLQTYTYSLFKEERRQISYSLLVSYYWDL